MAFNPFAAREPVAERDPQLAGAPVAQVPEYAVPQHGSYAVPSLAAGGPYTKDFGWAPGQRVGPLSTVETPSAQRMRVDLIQSTSNGLESPEKNYGRRDADDKHRHAVEQIDADGWTEQKGVSSSDRRWAPNPRSVPQPETRPTQQMAPRTYNFVRPFDTGYARTFNGFHFSMADHRRNYEVLGMAPVVSRRNTFRQEPVPWDQNVVDVPRDGGEDALPYSRLISPELPPQRSWRLV